MAKTVFALTFAFNERFFLPRWVAYYGSQLGLQHLYVLDHGSNDLSTEGLGPVNIIKVPKSPFDDDRKAAFASHMRSALLQYYDSGFVVDVDEFVVADPRKYRSLRDFAVGTTEHTPRCIGLDLVHVRALERGYVESLPILFQRRHVVFDSWMCKASFWRKPMLSGDGIHTPNPGVSFDSDLYLIHIKNFDYNHRLVREEITSRWIYSEKFEHQARKPIQYVKAIFDGIDIKVADGQVSRELRFDDELAICAQKAVQSNSGQYDFNLDGGFQGSRVHLLPEDFHHLF